MCVLSVCISSKKIVSRDCGLSYLPFLVCLCCMMRKSVPLIDTNRHCAHCTAITAASKVILKFQLPVDKWKLNWNKADCSDLEVGKVQSLSGKDFEQQKTSRIYDQYYNINRSINPILIRAYPRRWGWLDLPHSNSNLTNSHFPISLNSWHPPSLNQYSCSPPYRL